MLDEPFAGIDPLAIDDLKELIQKLTKKGLGILISDHNVRPPLIFVKKFLLLIQETLLQKAHLQKFLKMRL